MYDFLSNLINQDFVIILFFTLIVIPIYYKMGLLSFGKNGKNGNGYQRQIDELHEHAKIANEEMEEIRKDISDIKSDIGYIKGKLDK